MFAHHVDKMKSQHEPTRVSKEEMNEIFAEDLKDFEDQQAKTIPKAQMQMASLDADEDPQPEMTPEEEAQRVFQEDIEAFNAEQKRRTRLYLFPRWFH